MNIEPQYPLYAAQPDLFTARPMTVPEIAQAHGDQLSQEFLEWLPANLHIWDAFVSETLKILRKGYKNYSSYTIVEFLRHHSAAAERDSEWKINNNIRPYLPRLFDMIYPEYAGLWEFRTIKKEKGVKA